MARNVLGALALAIILAWGPYTHAQGPGSRVPENAVEEAGDETLAPAPAAASGAGSEPNARAQSSFLDRLWSSLAQEEDPDGPINTDRPTFTPANTVVPPGRLQFESGFTFDYQQTTSSRTTAYDFPELAMRWGVAKRVEFRTFWFGQTYAQTQSAFGRPTTQLNGPSDTEIGFKWQLIEGNKDVKWIPTTALITSIFAPVGGTSPYSSETVDPYINLIYGWTPFEKLSIGGSTGYLGRRDAFRARPCASQ